MCERRTDKRKAERFPSLSLAHNQNRQEKTFEFRTQECFPLLSFLVPLCFCGLISVRSTKTRTIDTNLPTFFAFSKKTRENLPSFLQRSWFFSRASSLSQERKEESKKTDALTLFFLRFASKKKKQTRFSSRDPKRKATILTSFLGSFLCSCAVERTTIAKKKVSGFFFFDWRWKKHAKMSVLPLHSQQRKLFLGFLSCAFQFPQRGCQADIGFARGF